MLQRYHELICILDRSGSMETIKDDAIGGFNAFIAAQKSEAEDTRVTLELFDDRFERLFEALPIAMVRPLDHTSFVPRGSTALLDAIGRSLTHARSRIGGLPADQQPEGVIVCILTDGEENSSREYTYHSISDLVAACRDTDGWEFVFLAANQDAIAEASKLSIGGANAASFQATGKGAAAAFESMTDMVAERRANVRKGRG